MDGFRLRIPLVVSVLVVAAMVALSAWAWTVTPAGLQIAVHWGIDGRPNGFAPKSFGFIILPCFALALSLLFAVLPAIEPRRANLLASRTLYLTGWYGGLFVLGAAHALIVLHAAGFSIDVPRWTLVAVASLVVVLGIFLGRSRSTFFVGVRLPWTLESELSWKKSNMLAGRGLIITGAAALLTLAFFGTASGYGVFAFGMAASFVASGIASYIWWKRDPRAHGGSSAHE
jgi:uncharacterized membrane protein